jgi:hypothetical protein
VWPLFGGSDPTSFVACLVVVFLSIVHERLKDLLRFTPFRVGLRDLLILKSYLESFALPLIASICDCSCSLYGPSHLYNSLPLALGSLLTTLYLGCSGARGATTYLFSFMCYHVLSCSFKMRV